ncbi:MAG: glycosyltransferase family 4 protein [Winogradskyella arenosi]
MKKIKILLTIPNFDTAGSGKVLYDLAKGINSERFEVHIACSHSQGDFFKEVEALGMPIHILETTVPLRPYWNIISRVEPFRNFVDKHGFDVVHSWHWSSDWSEVLGARLGHARFVYTKKAMTWGAVHWKVKSLLANYIITINEEMKGYFPWKRQQQLIPLGIDTSYYSPEYFNKVRKSNFTIITVANLVPVKGIEVLIKAIHILKENNINLQVLGDDRGDYANALKQQVTDLGLNSRIKFLGKHVDVRPFLAQADLYVIPTLNTGRKEGMPMALVEAMSMGLPVLGADISGINFVLKAFRNSLFEANNSIDLVKHIELVKSKTEEERLRLGREFRDYVISHFEMTSFISAHECLYTKLAK